MPKPVAATDIDGVFYKSSLVEKAIEYGVAQRLFDPEPFNEIEASRRGWQVRNTEGGYLAYLDLLVSGFVRVMTNVNVEQFNHMVTEMIRQQHVRAHAFPRRLMQAIEHSHYRVAISGSPEVLVRPFLEALNLGDFAIFASQFIHSDGTYTGEATPVGDKAAILRQLEAQGITQRRGSIGVGDTMSDALMLRYTDTAIMFNGSQTLVDYGRVFGWLKVTEVKDQITALRLDRTIGSYVETPIEEIIFNAQKFS